MDLGGGLLGLLVLPFRFSLLRVCLIGVQTVVAKFRLLGCQGPGSDPNNSSNTHGAHMCMGA